MVTTLGKVLNKIKSTVPSIYMETVYLAISVYVKIQSIHTKMLCTYEQDLGSCSDTNRYFFPLLRYLVEHSKVKGHKGHSWWLVCSAHRRVSRIPVPTTQCQPWPLVIMKTAIPKIPPKSIQEAPGFYTNCQNFSNPNCVFFASRPSSNS